MSARTAVIGLLMAEGIWYISGGDAMTRLMFSAGFLLLWFLYFEILPRLCAREDEGAKKKPSEKEIKACTRCGSRNISAFKHTKYWLEKDGPIMGIYTCQECGHEGLPIVFDSMENYGKFLKSKEK
jgi:DNA-directed RNA polymerase subunit M/transcription elongation factor TFIIS